MGKKNTYYNIEIKLFHAISLPNHHNRLTCSKVQIYIRTYRPTNEIFTEKRQETGHLCCEDRQHQSLLVENRANIGPDRFGLHHPVTVTNEGLGWDSLLKLE